MITGRDIRDGTVTGADLQNNTIGTRKIRDGSLLVRDFKRGQLRGGVGLPGSSGPDGQTGATGPNGVMGPQGAPGMTGVTGLTGATGTSRGFWAYNENFAGLGQPKTVKLTLKAGLYMVNSRMSAGSSTGATVTPFCNLGPIGGLGGGGDLAAVAVPPATETSLSLQGAITLPVDDGVQMQCTAESGINFGRAHIQAIKVDSFN
jgi:hypothetical protein